MAPGDIRHSQYLKNNYRNFTTRLQPRILNAVKVDQDGNENLMGLISYSHVVERFMDLAWEAEKPRRTLITNGVLNPSRGMISHHIANLPNRKKFAAKVTETLEWYVGEAAYIFRTALQPPSGLWDLTYTGEKYTKWTDDDSWQSLIHLDDYQAPLDDLIEEEMNLTVVNWDVVRPPRPPPTFGRATASAVGLAPVQPQCAPS